MGTIEHLSRRRHDEPWRRKREVAALYGFSIRWVERMVAQGMPSRMIGGQRRFRLSEVDAWLRAESHAREDQF